MSEKTRKIIDIATKVLTWILVAFTVLMVIFTVFTVSTVDKNERSIFGTRFYIVRTDSMSLSDKNADLDVHFNAGDIVMIKELDSLDHLEAGDIISFLSVNTDSYGETITHMIREVRKDAKGNLVGYVTYGTNTGASDEKLVEPEYVLGEYTGRLPGLGNFFAFVKSTPGYIVCILVPFLLLIAYNLFNVIKLFRQYKKEQRAIIDAERAEIEEERRRNEQVLRELMELREQMMGGTAPAAAPAPETDDASESASENN